MGWAAAALPRPRCRDQLELYAQIRDVQSWCLGYRRGGAILHAAHAHMPEFLLRAFRLGRPRRHQGVYNRAGRTQTAVEQLPPWRGRSVQLLTAPLDAARSSRMLVLPAKQS